MICYDDLCKRPVIFPSFTGMTHAEFDILAAEFAAAEAARKADSTTTRDGEDRRSAPGGGRPYLHDHRNRLLMALMWLRIYPTYEVLGFFFGLHKRNAQLNVRATLEILDEIMVLPLDRPDRDRSRPRLRTPQAVIDAFPGVFVIVDAKEQRTNRPTGYAAQEPYYSGKKKAHTIKTQIVVNPQGQIETTSHSVPGGANHDINVLRNSGVPEALAAGEGMMGDKGYVGAQDSYPEVPMVIPHKKPKGKELTDEQKAVNRVIAQARVVVEHTIAQLNRFTVLRQVFRGLQRWRHSDVLRVAAKLLNRRLAVVPLKSYAVA